MRWPTPANAPAKADALGTWIRLVLSCHTLSAQVTALRYDGVNPEWLGMGTALSHDALRNALKRLAEVVGTALA